MKKMFLKPSKTRIIDIKEFYENSNYLKCSEEEMWIKNKAPESFHGYYKFTSNLLMYIYYDYSSTNYGTKPVAKLDEITVAFRDGTTEYELIKNKLHELYEKQSQPQKSKDLEEQIKWLECLSKKIKHILPKFTKRFAFNTGTKPCFESIDICEETVSKSALAQQYVVLDLETNGLRTANDDLLSISIYDPAAGKIYNRLLPLELQPTVLTTYINGIDDIDVENEVPLCQKEFDDLVNEFDLTNKTILYYSGGKFDFDVLTKYCKRHNIIGVEKLNFENIKDRIASSSYTRGTISKDNLCVALGIKGVSQIHSGTNDCFLEWNLFEQFAYNKLIIKNNYIYQFNSDYVIPASYLISYRKLAEFANITIPELNYHSFLQYEYHLPSILVKKIKKFPTNISGISIENIINVMLGAKECNNYKFLFKNSKKLKQVGKLPSIYNEIPVIKNKEGNFESLNPQYEEYVNSVNEVSNIIKSGITEVIEYIREKVFFNKEIRTQEITFSENNKIFALCDLSTDDTILEIKTFDIFNSHHTDNVIRQMYYQKGQKQLYAMSVVFDFKYTKKMEKILDNLIFKIYKVEIEKENL